MRSSLALLWALLVLAPGCGPLLQAELELDEFCQSVERLDVPAVPEGAPTVRLSGRWLMPSLEERAGGAEVELVLVRVALNAVPELDLGGVIEAAEIVGLATGGEVPLARLDPVPGSGAGVVLLPGAELDLVELTSGGAMPVETRLSGILPAQVWALDVVACFSGRAKAAWHSPR